MVNTKIKCEEIKKLLFECPDFEGLEKIYNDLKIENQIKLARAELKNLGKEHPKQHQQGLSMANQVINLSNRSNSRRSSIYTNASGLENERSSNLQSVQSYFSGISARSSESNTTKFDPLKKVKEATRKLDLRVIGNARLRGGVATLVMMISLYVYYLRMLKSFSYGSPELIYPT